MYLLDREIKPETREEMIEYLRDHYRYNTMSSWNRSTSYAHCIKVTELGDLDSATRDLVWDILALEEAYESFWDILNEFSAEYDHFWQIIQNGRSGGYLVLVQGGEFENGKAFTSPGKSIDMDDNFLEWEDEELVDRVSDVWDFDQACESAVSEFVEFAKAHRVVEREILVPKKVLVAVSREDGSKEG